MRKQKIHAIKFNKTKVRVFDASRKKFDLLLEDRESKGYNLLKRSLSNDITWTYSDEENLFSAPKTKRYQFIPKDISKSPTVRSQKFFDFVKNTFSQLKSMFILFLNQIDQERYVIGEWIVSIQRKLRNYQKTFQLPQLPSWRQIFVPPSFLSLELKSSLAGFVCVVLVAQMLIPALMMANQGFRIKDNMYLQVAAGKQLLQDGNYTDLQDFSTQFAAVSDGLDTTSQDLESLQGNLSSLIGVIPGLSLVNDAQKMTNHGSELSQLTSEFLLAMDPFMEEGIDPFDPEEDSLIKALRKVQNTSNMLHKHLNQVNQDLHGVSMIAVPADMKNRFKQAKTILPQIIQYVEEVDLYFDMFLNILGAERNKRYLFLFQNNQELRATGGFIGSYGIMTMDQGSIKSLKVEEIYNPDGQMNQFIQSPQPLTDLTPRWFVRDANWFPHFPTSAKQIIEMYEHTGGATPDGVIAITPPMIESFLQVTGPIEMNDYGETVTSDNFLEITQYETSENYQDPDNPKQFIADLAPKLLSQIMESGREDFSGIVQSLMTSIERRHIMMFFQNQELQDKVSEINLAGEMYQTPKDYLMVNHNNIGGYKTDGVMQDQFNVETEISNDGEVINTVTVQRRHTGGNTDFEGWNEDNINYMRIYTPQGSKLLSVSGFENRELKEWQANIESYERSRRLRKIERSQKRYQQYHLTQGQEAGKEVFSGWVITEPQQVSEVRIRYKLPFRVSEESLYSFILQKQSGVDTLDIQHTLFLPEEWSVDWLKSSTDTKYGENRIQYRTQKPRDHYLGIQVTE